MAQGSPMTNFLNAPAVENAAQTAKINDIQIETGNEQLDSIRAQKEQQRQLKQLKTTTAMSKFMIDLYVRKPEEYEKHKGAAIRQLQVDGLISPTQNFDDVEPSDWEEMYRLGTEQLEMLNPKTMNQGAFLNEYEAMVDQEVSRGTAKEQIPTIRQYRERMLSGAPTTKQKEYADYEARERAAGRQPKSPEEWSASTQATAAADKEQAVSDVRTAAAEATQLKSNQQAYDSIMVPMNEFMKAADQVWGVRERGENDPGYIGAIQVARASKAQMAPALKQMFRAAGEGVFTDRDQQILIDMIPGLLTEPTARKRIMDNMMAIIRFKMGLPPIEDSPYQPGDIVNGYRYTGGNWKDPSNYEELNDGG